MKKAIILGLRLGLRLGLVSVCVSAPAFGAAKARPHAAGDTSNADKAVTSWSSENVVSQANYTSGLFRSYLGDALSYSKAYAKQETDKTTVKAKESEAAAKQAEGKFRASDAKLQAQILANGEAIRKKERELEVYQTQLKSAERLLSTGVVSPSDQQKKEDAERQIQRLSAELRTKEDPAMAELNRQVDAVQGELAGSQADYAGKMQELQRTLSPESQAALHMKGFETGVNLMFEKMKNSVYDSKLLLTDFDTLKKEYKLAELGIDVQTLKDGLGNRLSNTLIGNYVNAQVTKAMRQVCAIRAQCDATDTGKQAVEIDRLMKQILEDPSVRAAEPASVLAVPAQH